MDLGRPVARHHIRRPHETDVVDVTAVDDPTEGVQPEALPRDEPIVEGTAARSETSEP